MARKWEGWGHLRDTARFVVDCFTRLALVNDCRRDSKASIIASVVLTVLGQDASSNVTG